MQNYFKDLLQYDRWANEQVFAKLLSLEAPEKAIRLMAHIIAAQEIWLSRILNDEFSSKTVFPDWSLTTTIENAEVNHNKLDKLIRNETDFNRTIHYQNTKGKSYSNKLDDILIHLFNHGTYHRAQIATLMRQSGLDPAVTDYIAFKR